jgi:hypothetical protein
VPRPSCVSCLLVLHPSRVPFLLVPRLVFVCPEGPFVTSITLFTKLYLFLINTLVCSLSTGSDMISWAPSKITSDRQLCCHHISRTRTTIACHIDHRVPLRPSCTTSTIAYHIDHRVPHQPSRTTSTIAYRRQPLRTTVNRRIPPGTMKVPESAGYPRVPPGVIAY